MHIVSVCLFYWLNGKKCFNIIHLILEFNMYLLIESTGREILLYTGKGQWNSYLAHRYIFGQVFADIEIKN